MRNDGRILSSAFGQGTVLAALLFVGVFVPMRARGQGSGATGSVSAPPTPLPKTSREQPGQPYATSRDGGADVLERNRADLLRISGVSGVGYEQADDGSIIIDVWVDNPADLSRVKRKCPRLMEGVAVKVLQTPEAVGLPQVFGKQNRKAN